MINTQLHNSMIDDIALQLQIASQRLTVQTKEQILFEKLKNMAKILLLVLLVLLIISLAYKLYLYFDLGRQYNQISISKRADLHKQKQSKIIQTNKTYKNGTEFVKQNHFIYKRVWKDGLLKQETKLEDSIEKSRKNRHVKIPQLSVEPKGDVKDIVNQTYKNPNRQNTHITPL